VVEDGLTPVEDSLRLWRTTQGVVEDELALVEDSLAAVEDRFAVEDHASAWLIILTV
jgi:hypothetical protein